MLLSNLQFHNFPIALRRSVVIADAVVLSGKLFESCRSGDLPCVAERNQLTPIRQSFERSCSYIHYITKDHRGWVEASALPRRRRRRRQITRPERLINADGFIRDALLIRWIFERGTVTGRLVLIQLNLFSAAFVFNRLEDLIRREYAKCIAASYSHSRVRREMIAKTLRRKVNCLSENSVVSKLFMEVKFKCP